MSIADFIAQGIGPSGDIPHFITVGLDIGAVIILPFWVEKADVKDPSWTDATAATNSTWVEKTDVKSS